MSENKVILKRGEPGGGHRASVTGVQLAQGIGVQEAKGFWADAWSQVLRRRGAVAGLIWIGIVLFFAIFSPILASGHPLILRTLGPGGEVTGVSSPLWRYLSAGDVLLLIAGVVGPIWILTGKPGRRGPRAGMFIAACLQGVAIVVLSGFIGGLFTQRGASDAMRQIGQQSWFPAAASGGVALLVGLLFLLVPLGRSRMMRVGWTALVAVVVAVVCAGKWDQPLERFDYRERIAAGRATAVYTLVPFSPTESSTAAFTRPPGTRVSDTLGPGSTKGRDDAYVLGTDAVGQDVLSQLMHACRLSISIGLVSTGIAVAIGVTIGAIMGYFGGWIDLLLYRVVEIFMAVPVLFLLIVAAGVLPEELRTTYVTMAIIGCVTWTGAARFTRAEFMKLRNQDFVQSAKAVGLPLRSILFKHMLPNGVTPVLVDASFAIAAAILIESILSYLNLGPVGQPSWGKLLYGATGDAGSFNWWLAIFPGIAIFLTVLSYNLIGEALRDAIDPKLKKARV